MGFALTLYYLFATFLTPAEIMPALLPYRIMLVLLLLTLLASMFTMLGHRFSFKAPQLPLLMALVADCAITVLYAVRWFGGAMDAVLDLLFLAGIVLMVCWNVISVSRLRAVALVLACIGVIVSVEGMVALETGYNDQKFVIHETDQDQAGRPLHIDRIIGLGVLNDPNDLGQFLLINVALLGCCWRPGKKAGNLFKVIIPSLIMLTGILLTRSRGAMLGLLVLVLFLLQKRLGKFGAVIGSIAGVVGILAMTVLTGRSLSMSEGSAAGRLDAWYAGLQMLKGSPVFGVGFQRFLEHNPLTAHNSYMLALAELGLPGFFIWLAMIVSSTLQVRAISFISGGTPELDELKHAARSVYLAFVMFVVTAWFLSRSYTTILFVLIGCAVAVTEMARKRGVLGEAKEKISWSVATAVSALMFVVSVYVLLRIRGISA
jgi:putative inorganic carbon (HCO3(-)) transporter